MTAGHRERHFTERIGWLRAAVLGANDGIVSTATLVPAGRIIVVVSVLSLLSLAGLGALAAGAGGSSRLRGAWRVTFWGALALALTAGIGRLFGTTV